MNSPNEQERQRLSEILDQHVGQLSENFENVEIFCSNFEQGGEGTVSFQRGTGNWHARLNHARDWILTHDEETKCKARDSYEKGKDEQ